jgi:hypothetical protein
MNMSEDEDPETQRRANHTYYLGQSAGLDEAATYVRGLAVARFGQKRDSEAINLRNIADELEGRAKARNDEADKKFGK